MQRKARYSRAFPAFVASLTPSQRSRINGTSKPDWQGTRTFSLPVISDSPAYRTEVGDPVIEVLEELGVIKGALPKIALWVNDQMGGLDLLKALEQFRIAIARVCEAKNPRLEAFVVSLAIGMNLRGNANGFAIAQHFGLSPQALHEILGDTCKALGLPKPLAKLKKDRYRKTQYSHNLNRKKAVT